MFPSLTSKPLGKITSPNESSSGMHFHQLEILKSLFWLRIHEFSKYTIYEILFVKIYLVKTNCQFHIIRKINQHKIFYYRLDIQKNN